MAAPLVKYFRWCARDEINFDLLPKIYSVYFKLLSVSGKSFIKNPVQFCSVIPLGVPLPRSNSLQYYVKRKKCKVNDVIFPSGCEARAIILGSKNIKISIFTGATWARAYNTFLSTISCSRSGFVLNSEYDSEFCAYKKS